MRFLITAYLFTVGLVRADTFLIKSADAAGRTWTDIDPAPEGRFLHWLRIDSRDSTLYALTQRDFGTDYQLSTSVDGGQTWQVTQSFPPNIFVISATAPSETLYVAYEIYGYPRKDVVIVKITDHGQKMEQYVADGLAVMQDDNFVGFLTMLKADPLAPERLYALVSKEFCCTGDIFALYQALWVSGDGGRRWDRLDPPVTDGCTYPEVQIDSSDSSLYVACGHELFKSMDGGASWVRKAFPDGRLWSLEIGPGPTRAVLYGIGVGAIWKSGDGETWERLGAFPAGSDQRFVTPHPLNPSLLFASTLDGVEKSEDGGFTWMVVTEYPLRIENPFSFRLVIDPLAQDALSVELIETSGSPRALRT